MDREPGKILTLESAAEDQPLHLVLRHGQREKNCLPGVVDRGEGHIHQAVAVLVIRKVTAVIELFQAHPIVIHNTIGRNRPPVPGNQEHSGLCSIQLFQFLHGGAAVQVQVVIPSDLLQVGEVGDHRSLLAAKGQVDEVGHIGSAQSIRHPLELCQFSVRETVQPLDKVVQLIRIDPCSLQALEDGARALDLLHRAVPGQRVPDAQGLQHPDGAVVLVRRDGEGDGDQAVFQVVCVIECCSDLHGINLRFCMTAAPYRAISTA